MFFVNITDKQAVEAAEALIAHCYATICAECMWHKGASDCMFQRHMPRSWAIPALPAEPEPEEPNKPNLCKILKVDVGEEFDVRLAEGGRTIHRLRITEDGIPEQFIVICEKWELFRSLTVLLEIIARPSCIIRKPKIVLTDDDKAIVRRCIADGLEWFAVDKAGGAKTRLFETCPAKTSSNMFICGESYRNESVAGCLFPWATHEGSPYYLPDLVGEERQ